MSKYLIIPIFIPHLGCPHTCIFCNQKKIAGNYSNPSSQKIKDTVATYLKSFKRKTGSYIELAFYGGSFTAVDDKLQEELLKTAFNLKNNNLINGIRISTRPDYIDPEIVKRLLKYQVDTVELGVQSLDSDVLFISERGHSSLNVVNAVKYLKEAKRRVGIQLMPGLPLDSREKVLSTTKKVINLNPDFVRIYPTVVIKKTKLAQMYQMGLFQPWSLEETVEIGAEMFILFSKANIPVIRLGLQATENLQVSKDLLAGPYHPAYGELVKGRVFRKQLELLINNFIDSSLNVFEVYCNPREISQIKGQHLANIHFLQEKYNIFLKVSVQPDLPPGYVAIKNSLNNSFFFLSRREFLYKYRISD